MDEQKDIDDLNSEDAKKTAEYSDSVPFAENDFFSDTTKMDAGENFKKFELYKVIIDTRKFEIENFWKRTVFFWGALAIILAGYFNVKSFEQYLIFISLTGFFYNLIFSFSLRGSKYWQEHWETLAKKFEKKMNFKIFALGLNKDILKENKSVYWIFRPKRLSVSKLTMILSDTTCFLWIILIIKDLKFLYSIKSLFIYFSFNFQKNHHVFEFHFTYIALVVFLYIFLFAFLNYKFFKSGTKDHEKGIV